MGICMMFQRCKERKMKKIFNVDTNIDQDIEIYVW